MSQLERDTTDFTSPASARKAAEQRVRKSLGVPDKAKRVLVFGETSHWDPNWLYTSTEYYSSRIKPTLDEMILALEADPRRVFSLECMFFIRLYWSQNPDQHGVLRRLINEGRVRLTGSGITTPDVTLPDTEAILRDFLLGQEWLRKHGMTAEPRLAYLPDDFGYTPSLPSLLRSLGIHQAGITRIDGMYFVGSDYSRRSTFPRTGSSAETLLSKEKTQDFIWQAPDGAQVLCHWNAFTYFQGDLLGSLGIIRWMGKTFGMSLRAEGHVARQIGKFVKALAPLAKTPYMFCPIGCDFNGPIPNLLDMLDRYNEERSEKTGVYVVNGGLDDYLTMVAAYAEELPTLDFDANPYWMGFYSSRPLAKRMCNRIARKLTLAERLNVQSSVEPADPSLAPGDSADDGRKQEKMARAWDLLAIANHHDFITGTSPDRVWYEEQLPWLNQADSLSDELLAHAGKWVARRQGSSPVVNYGGPSPDNSGIEWEYEGGRLRVSSPFYSVVLDEGVGGCIVSYVGRPDGAELLKGPGNDLVVYVESGGLWRMGHEYLGGSFKSCLRSSTLPAKIYPQWRDGLLEVRVESQLAGSDFTRWLWFRGDSPVVRLAVEGAARRRRTITCSFPTRLLADSLAMDVPGGFARRPYHKLYRPTFWPGRSFFHVQDQSTGEGLAAFLGGPFSVSAQDDGTFEWVALRNAPREKAWGVVPLVSHPASGLADDVHRFTYGIWHTQSGDWRENRLPHVAGPVLHGTWTEPGATDLDGLAADLLTCDHPQVAVTAVKPAHRGPGVVVRLTSYAPTGTQVRVKWPGVRFSRAFACDALERDLEELSVIEGRVKIVLKGSLTSIRLII